MFAIEGVSTVCNWIFPLYVVWRCCKSCGGCTVFCVYNFDRPLAAGPVCRDLNRRIVLCPDQPHASTNIPIAAVREYRLFCARNSCCIRRPQNIGVVTAYSNKVITINCIHSRTIAEQNDLCAFFVPYIPILYIQNSLLVYYCSCKRLYRAIDGVCSVRSRFFIWR